jgi:hypothetical protein
MKHATIEDLRFELWLRQRNSGDIKFRTSYGDLLSIKEMSNSHIEAAINQLK